jgi:hypothetical protein
VTPLSNPENSFCDALNFYSDIGKLNTVPVDLSFSSRTKLCFKDLLNQFIAKEVSALSLEREVKFKNLVFANMACVVYGQIGSSLASTIRIVLPCF